MNFAVGPIAAGILFRYSHVKKGNSPEIADTIESYANPILKLIKKTESSKVYTHEMITTSESNRVHSHLFRL